MANFTCLAAARHSLLQRAGWDVEAQGLFGAPTLNVVVGDEVHVTALKALAMLGLGRARVTRVPVDAQGRMRADSLPPLDDRTILCLQAGNVNTGAIDPLAELIPRARAAGAWVHVDGAFGLWAAAAPERAALVAGIENADAFAAVTNFDNTNIMASQVAKEISRKLDTCTADLQQAFSDIADATTRAELDQIGANLQDTYVACDAAANAADGFSQYLQNQADK